MSDYPEKPFAAGASKGGWKTHSLARSLSAMKRLTLLIVSPADRFYNGDLFLKLTEGDSFERSLDQFARSFAGRGLLEDRPDVVRLLRDRASLEQCPEGSLGRCYREFLAGAQLDEDVYTAAVKASSASETDAARAWYRERMGITHDLRHLLAGYGSDAVGEACLLTFRFAQTRHGGLLPLLLLLVLQVAISGRLGALIPALFEAYQRGRRGRLTDLLAWENNLHHPLAAQRAWLGLDAPQHYAPSVAPDVYDAKPVGRRGAEQ